MVFLSILASMALAALRSPAALA